MSLATRRAGIALFCLAVACVVLGPMLRPGFPLRFDLVSVPDQAFSRDTWGLGDGLPRAVPLDAVTALLERLLPDAWLTQLLALTALVLAGTGAARLTAPALPGQLLAAFVAIWNPFVLEQLAIGHVPHLLAYGALPWVGLYSYQVAQSGTAARWARTALVVALGSLTPGGGVLCLLACLAGLVAGGSRGHRWSVGTAVTAVLLQAPWVLTGAGANLAGEQAQRVTDRAGGLDAFALRSETGWGRIVDALGQGGMWNASALPTSRFTVLAKVSCVLFILLGLAGLAVLARLSRLGPSDRPPGRAAAAAAAVVAVTFLVAVLPVLPGGSGALAWASDAIPGAALLRDGHRWLAPLAMGTAVASGFSVLALPRGAADQGGRGGRGGRSGRAGQGDAYRVAVALFTGLIVVASLPDLGAGLAGRLRSWSYPPDYLRAQAVLDRAESASGDASSVLILPWSAFRNFGWTGGQTVLDPAPRMFAHPSVVTHALRVSGTLLPQEGRQARSMDAALADGRLTGAELSAAGIGWVAVEHRTSGTLPRLPPTLVTALAGPDLTLYRLPPPAPAAPSLRMARIALAATGFALYLALCAAAALSLAVTALRPTTTSRSRHEPRHPRQPRSVKRWPLPVSRSGT